jgi:hypothetical protein
MEMRQLRLRTVLMCVKPYLGRRGFKRLTPVGGSLTNAKTPLPLVNFEDALRPFGKFFKKNVYDHFFVLG